MTMKKFFFFLPALLFLITSCAPTPDNNADKYQADYLVIEGRTMGTYYRITYRDSLRRDFQAEFDRLLIEINDEVSTYIDTSTISRFNTAQEGITLGEPSGSARHFIRNLQLAGEIWRISEGAFDPTVMPLVNYWGFGYTPKNLVTQVDSNRIDSLLAFVGFDKVTMSGRELRKQSPGVQLDFSACAKGYGVDELARYLEGMGIRHYLVDIGGEARARGYNPRGGIWNIGINTPREDAAVDDIEIAIPLENRSVATSGNYRNYYEVGGIKYSHTIHPKRGFPQRSNLMSASVFHADCMTADAYATTFMVMGMEAAYQLAQSRPDVEAYFLYVADDGQLKARYTDGLRSLVEKQQ